MGKFNLVDEAGAVHGEFEIENDDHAHLVLCGNLKAVPVTATQTAPVESTNPVQEITAPMEQSETTEPVQVAPETIQNAPETVIVPPLTPIEG